MAQQEQKENYGKNPAMVKEGERICEEKKSFVMLKLDIDNFGRFNKQFCEKVADKISMNVGNILKDECTKKNADFYRVRPHGDEFVIFVRSGPTGNELVHALAVHDLITRALMGEKIEQMITVSVGLCLYKPNYSWEEWYDNSDIAQNLAKKNGKNCLVDYDAPPKEPPYKWVASNNIPKNYLMVPAGQPGEEGYYIGLAKNEKHGKPVGKVGFDNILRYPFGGKECKTNQFLVLVAPMRTVQTKYDFQAFFEWVKCTKSSKWPENAIKAGFSYGGQHTNYIGKTCICEESYVVGKVYKKGTQEKYNVGWFGLNGKEHKKRSFEVLCWIVE